MSANPFEAAEMYRGMLSASTPAELEQRLVQWRAFGHDLQSFVVAHLLFLQLQALRGQLSQAAAATEQLAAIGEVLVELGAAVAAEPEPTPDLPAEDDITLEHEPEGA